MRSSRQPRSICMENMMTYRPVRLIFLAVWISIAWTIGMAGQYHVAPDGSDVSGNGSAAQPWATITHALGQVPDDSLVLVSAGEYTGQVRLDQTFSSGVTVRSYPSYGACLRHDGTVVRCYYGQGITLEGFDIAHAGPGADPLVIQIQDLIGDPGGAETVERIVIRDCIIHDSYNNDLLKINNGCAHILVEGNMFYNQSGSDEHMDVNSVADVLIRDNIFFNDFAASGRTNGNNTSSYIVVKDSNGDSDGRVGSENIVIRRNIFLHYEGSSGTCFVLVGEDGQPYFEGRNVLVENNLLLGDSANVIRAAWGVKGGQGITFRHNTVTGDLPALAYAMRLNTEGSNPPNEDIEFYGNIWSDPMGTMGAQSGSGSNDFSDTPPGETVSWLLDGNLYWNGGTAIPSDPAELINYTDDLNAMAGDPLLPDPASAVRPHWRADQGIFNDGSTTIRAAFVRLVRNYGIPTAAGPAADTGDPATAPADDILKTRRSIGPAPDRGAVETGTITGDLDLDGATRLLDLVILHVTLAGHVAEGTTPCDCPICGDLDGDGRLTIADAQRLAAVLAGNETF
ncbi:MAG: hypothetical protein JXQ27_01215 [Acidobacteria bacterium]|nr:hypothetical protein [Acidobacteriota bacterium]